jgi:hypothetical protein
MRNSTDINVEQRKSAAGFPFHKIGAVFYGLWGLWHFLVVKQIFELASTQIEPGVLQARIYQGAFHILWFAIGAIVIAIWFNWRNDRLGYWANLVMISWTEVGLFLFFIRPGYFPWLPGIIAPILWILAVVFTTLGFYLCPKSRLH